MQPAERPLPVFNFDTPYRSIVGKKTIGILSIDGGGVRGIIPLEVLTALEQKANALCVDLFQVMGGASIGSFIISGLAFPGRKYTASTMLTDFVKLVPNVFQSRGVIQKIWSLDYWRENRYDPSNLDNIVTSYTGTTTLGETSAELIVPAAQACTRQAFTFSSTANPDTTLHDMIRAATAAETYFPAYQVKIGETIRTFVDGGTYNNNPAIDCYLDLANRISPETDVVVLSIGTGNGDPDLIYSDMKDAGVGYWATHISDLCFDLASDANHQRMMKLFSGSKPQRGIYSLPKTSPKQGNRYYARVEMRIPESLAAMDNVTPANIQALQQAGQKLAQTNDAILDAVVNLLKPAL